MYSRDFIFHPVNYFSERIASPAFEQPHNIAPTLSNAISRLLSCLDDEDLIISSAIIHLHYCVIEIWTTIVGVIFWSKRGN